MQPIGDASGRAPGEEEDEPEGEEEEEEDKSIGSIAKHFLNKPNTDKTFRVRKEGKHHYIGNKHVIIMDDDIIIKESGERFYGTAGLWGLITSKEPDKELIDWDKNDIKDYERLMIKTNTLHQGNNPKNPYPKSSKSKKWLGLLAPIWNTREKSYEGEGVVIMSSDPNALLERFDLLHASQKAGHTGVANEMVSICDELKRQGVLDTKSYKNFNSIIKNDST